MPSSTLRSHARRSIRQVALVSVAALLSLLGTLASPPALAQGLALDSAEVADQLVFPLGIIDAGDGSGRLFLVQQTGEILVWNGVSVEATPFLDLSDSGLDRVICCGERGLLGLVFNPDYATNGELYVNYTRDSDGQLQTVLSRFQVSDMDPDLADHCSERKRPI
jgi:hypothetical protein